MACPSETLQFGFVGLTEHAVGLVHRARDTARIVRGRHREHCPHCPWRAPILRNDRRLPTRTGHESTPGPAENHHVSAAARPSYGHAYATADVAAAARPGEPSNVLPLLVLVIGLAVATIWFVALPVLEKQPAGRSCDVFVLASGTTKCVPTPEARAARHKAKLAARTGS